MKTDMFVKTGATAIATAMIAAGTMISGAAAQERLSADYEAQAADYLESRMASAEDAQVRVTSEPYQVRAEMADGREYDAWAVDTEVRGYIENGPRTSGSYTVIYVDGRPVATDADLERDIARIRTAEESVYAAR